MPLNRFAHALKLKVLSFSKKVKYIRLEMVQNSDSISKGELGKPFGKKYLTFN